MKGERKKGGGRKEIYNAVNIARRSRKRGRRREGQEKDGGGTERKGKRVLFVFQYPVGWLKTVAMLDPVKLSELAKASTDGWAPSPTTASLGFRYDRGTQTEVNTNTDYS